VGDSIGDKVGSSVGNEKSKYQLSVGSEVGMGDMEGSSVGDMEGSSVGDMEGSSVGAAVASVGSEVGISEGE